MDNESKKIIKELSIKYNLDTEIVESIIRSPFKFIRTEINKIKLTDEETEDTFKEKTKNFNIPYIGKLYASYKNYYNILKRKHELRRKKITD